MKRLNRVRLAVLVLTALPAFASSARADWFKNICHKDGCGDKQRVVIPSREIEIETERPRVSVRELGPRTRTVRTADTIPMIGTLYMPMTIPMVGAMTREVAGTREVECDTRSLGNPFEAAHRAEVAIYRGEMAKAELQRTIEYQNRILQRIGSMTTTGSDGGSTSSPSAIEEKVNKLAAAVEKLDKRLTDVEKLLIYHDNQINNKPNPTLPMPNVVDDKNKK